MDKFHPFMDIMILKDTQSIMVWGMKPYILNPVLSPELSTRQLIDALKQKWCHLQTQLLMVQKSQTTIVLMVLKPVVNDGINYQPQLVLAGFQPSTVPLIRDRRCFFQAKTKLWDSYCNPVETVSIGSSQVFWRNAHPKQRQPPCPYYEASVKVLLTLGIYMCCTKKRSNKKKNVEIPESQPFFSNKKSGPAPRCLWCPVSNSLPPLAFRNGWVSKLAKSKGQKNGSFFVGVFARFVIMGWIFISFLSEFLHSESLPFSWAVGRLLSCKSGIIWCMAAPKLVAPKNGWMDGKQRPKIDQSQYLWSQVATYSPFFLAVATI